MCYDICKYFKLLECKSYEECLKLCIEGKRALGITDAKIKNAVITVLSRKQC